MKIVLVVYAFVLLFAQTAFSQVIPPTGDEIGSFLNLIPSLKDGGTIGIIILVVQILLFVFRSTFLKLDGKIKLVAVLGLTWIIGVLSMVFFNKIGLVEAFMHSTSIAALMVFVNELKKHFFPAK